MGVVFDAINKHAGTAGLHAQPTDAGLDFAPPPDPDSDADRRLSGRLAPVRTLPLVRDAQALAGIDDRLVALTDPGSVMSEEYRAIRTRLMVQWHNQRNLIHTLTSATPKEGKTITALNLGFSFAEITDRQIVVVECDLRIPVFARMLNLPAGPDLGQLLQGQATLGEAIRPTVSPNLSVIPAGTESGEEATQLLGSGAMSELLDRLRRQYDHVFLDTPPVIDLADAGIVGRQSDDVILVVRMNRTPRHLIEQAIRTLNSYDTHLTGSILTYRHQWTVSGEYGYHYGRSSRYYRRYHRRSA